MSDDTHFPKIASRREGHQNIPGHVPLQVLRMIDIVNDAESEQ